MIAGNCRTGAIESGRLMEIADMKAVAVMSGGLDSTVLGYLLRSQNYELRAISFDYGQRHRKELDHARAVAADLAAPWILIDLAAGGIGQLLRGSALTDPSIEVPEGHYAAENMRVTVVPNRNAIMLAIACAGAGSWGAEAVAFAVHAGDHPVYPDCRPAFVRAFEAMERLAMEGTAHVEVLAPFVDKTKADIVTLGHQLGVPFERTWSCYNGRDIHCGACGTCYERREAFRLAGVGDPTMYAAEPVFPTP
jgi:7-cyano-7-deazaguanine synthase